jgi:hypothetical protein
MTVETGNAILDKAVRKILKAHKTGKGDPCSKEAWEMIRLRNAVHQMEQCKNKFNRKEGIELFDSAFDNLIRMGYGVGGDEPLDNRNWFEV